MKKILFLCAEIIFVSCATFAQTVDYNKPFDEIKSQISSFDSRHSLMPIEQKVEEKNNIVDEKANEALVPHVASENMKVEEKNTKNSESKQNDFQTIVVEGKDEESSIKQEELAPVVLKPIPHKKYDGSDLILSNMIEEKVSDVVNIPLNVKKKTEEEKTLKSQKILPKKEYIIEGSEEGDTMLHVASYNDENSAYNALKWYEKKYPQTKLFEPFVRYEKVENKGWYYRLYFIGDVYELRVLCDVMKKNKDWCMLIK